MIHLLRWILFAGAILQFHFVDAIARIVYTNKQTNREKTLQTILFPSRTTKRTIIYLFIIESSL